MSEMENKLISSPQERLGFNVIFNHLSHIEAKDVNAKFVFDYFKNYLICSAILWVGIKSFQADQPLYLKPFLYVGGTALSFIALLLCALNVHYGLEAYFKLRNINSVGNIKIALFAAILFCSIEAILVTGK